MKKTILFFVLMFFISNQIQAQCDRSANTFGNNSNVTMYNVLGDVNVILNSSTSVSVSLGANFSTASGPDVRIFLVDRGNLTNEQLKTPAMFNSRPKIEMGMNPAYLNTYTKIIPAGMNISDFETVYFYCQAFNQFWDFGSFTPFTSTNCATVLATNTLGKSNFKMYPNPVQNELIFELNSTSNIYEIKIYNIIGAQVATKKIFSGDNAKMDVSLLDSGIYLVVLQDKNNNRIVERFVKQ
jgi:Secretion system C-terminal sorting domain/Electron transfer DM13